MPIAFSNIVELLLHDSLSKKTKEKFCYDLALEIIVDTFTETVI